MGGPGKLAQLKAHREHPTSVEYLEVKRPDSGFDGLMEACVLVLLYKLPKEVCSCCD